MAEEQSKGSTDLVNRPPYHHHQYLDDATPILHFHMVGAWMGAWLCDECAWLL
jgi:hypothetical protein